MNHHDLMTATNITDDDCVTVQLRHVLALANPLLDPPWWDGPQVTPEEVWAEATHPTSCEHDEPAYMVCDGCRQCDIRRIAHFVVHGVDPDDARPILIDVGVGGYCPDWPISDGNHRVAAAAVLELEEITVDYTGDEDRALAILVDGRDAFDVMEEEALYA